jgi:broad specificity phosphatase PhoE
MQLPNPLKYTYYIMRHGQSEANVDKIIVAKLENGILPKYGLTEKGQQQSYQAAKLFLSEQKKSDQFVLVYSPFSRAKETAQEVAKVLDCSHMIELEDLRERDFGDLELMSNENYNKFWIEDRANPNSKIFNSESPNEVLHRVVKVIEDLEEMSFPAGQKIMLVSHGDTLQILQTAFLNISVAKHNTDVLYMDNAEIRRLN